MVNRHKQLQLFLGLAGCLIAGVAFAVGGDGGGAGGAGGCAISATGDMTSGVMCQFKAATTKINQQLIQPALFTAIAAIMLQWVLSYWKDLFKPDISDILLKAAGLIAWFGATVLLIQNVDRMATMFTDYLALAGSLSSLSTTQFSPGGVIDKTMDAISATNKAFEGSAPGGMLDVAANMFAALMLMFANIFTFLAGLTVALSLFVAILEFWIMFAVAPLAFALIPLSAFRDQGFAPIKGVISLGLRVLILGVVVSVFSSLTDVVIRAMSSMKGVGNASALMGMVWYYLAGMAGCAMMALSAGKIASAIASGSASFSGSDAIRGGMQLATTAAAGAGAVVAGKALLASAGGGAANALGGAASKMGLSMPSAHDVGKSMGNAINGGPGLGVSPTDGSGFGQPLQSRPGVPLSGGGAPSAPSNGGAPSTSSGGSRSSAPSGSTPAPSSGSQSAPVGNGTGSSGSPENKSGASSPTASSAPVSAASPSAEPASSGKSDVAGDATSAGIGGATGDKSSFQKRSVSDRMHDAAQQTAQDSHAVSIQMHVGKE